MDLFNNIDLVLKIVYFVFSIALISKITERVFNFKDKYQGQDMVQSIFILCYGIFVSSVLYNTNPFNIEGIIEVFLLSFFGIMFFVLMKFISDNHYKNKIDINKELFYHNPAAFIIETSNMISYTIMLTSTIFLLELRFTNIQDIFIIYSIIFIFYFLVKFFYDLKEMNDNGGITDFEAIERVNVGAAIRHGSFRIGLSLALISPIKNIEVKNIASFNNIIEIIASLIICFFLYQIIRKLIIKILSSVKNPNKEIFDYGNTNVAKKESSINITSGSLILLII